MQGQAIKLSETPASIRRGVPTVGQHNADVLGEWLGYDSERVDELAEEGRHLEPVRSCGGPATATRRSCVAPGARLRETAEAPGGGRLP